MNTQPIQNHFKSVMIVDDASIVRITAKNALRSLGIGQVYEAESVDSAWRLLVSKLEKKEKVDLILCDWVMPGEDGLCLVRRVKADPRFSNIPVILVTSERGDDKVIEALEEGIAGYIPKPISNSILKQKLLNLRNLLFKKSA